MSEAEYGKKLRRDFLEAAADLAEIYYRGDRGRSSAGRSSKSRDGYGGDLLYRYAKMQATQLTHLARVGIAQVSYARQLMDAWYGGSTDGYGDKGGYEEVCVTGNVDEKASKKFMVANDEDEDKTFGFRVTSFCHVGGDERFNHDATFVPTSLPVKANQSEPVEIKLASLDKKLFLKGETYEATIEILDGKKVIDCKTLIVKAH